MLFIHERPNMYFTSIDGQPLAFMHDRKVLEFRPGRHVFEANISNYQAFGSPAGITYTTRYTVKSYRLDLDMRPGFTYALNFRGINVDRLPDRLCFEGEPHDAPGSKVNPTGEFRIMSSTVQSFACATSFKTEEVGEE